MPSASRPSSCVGASRYSRSASARSTRPPAATLSASCSIVTSVRTCDPPSEELDRRAAAPARGRRRGPGTAAGPPPRRRPARSAHYPLDTRRPGPRAAGVVRAYSAAMPSILRQPLVPRRLQRLDVRRRHRTRPSGPGRVDERQARSSPSRPRPGRSWSGPAPRASASSAGSPMSSAASCAAVIASQARALRHEGRRDPEPVVAQHARERHRRPRAGVERDASATSRHRPRREDRHRGHRPVATRCRCRARTGSRARAGTRSTASGPRSTSPACSRLGADGRQVVANRASGPGRGRAPRSAAGRSDTRPRRCGRVMRWNGEPAAALDRLEAGRLDVAADLLERRAAPALAAPHPTPTRRPRRRRRRSAPPAPASGRSAVQSTWMCGTCGAARRAMATALTSS